MFSLFFMVCYENTINIFLKGKKEHAKKIDHISIFSDSTELKSQMQKVRIQNASIFRLQ